MSSNQQTRLAASSNEVVDLYNGVRRVLGTVCSNGQTVGSCKFGIYLFRDYDGEPIYVGQTIESLATRIRRHLTNQRTDAVAMRVLDPFEVDEIEMWPFWDWNQLYREQSNRQDQDIVTASARQDLQLAEYTVYVRALRESRFGAVLNEQTISGNQEINLPDSTRGRILPDELREARNHPDLRLARRARTIANLAAVISERQVSLGIRRTLQAQALRLEHLARVRLEALNAPTVTDVAQGNEGSLDEARTTLLEYADALTTLDQASSSDEIAEAATEVAHIVQKMQSSSRQIANLMRLLLGGDRNP